MKNIILGLVLALLVGVVMAQTQDTYTFKGDTACEMDITLATRATVDYQLKDGDSVLKAGTLLDGDAVVMVLPVSNRTYALTVVYADDNTYTVDAARRCSADPMPQDDTYEAQKARLFAAWHWDEDTIDWFNRAESLLSPTGGRGYVEAGIEALNAAEGH